MLFTYFGKSVLADIVYQTGHDVKNQKLFQQLFFTQISFTNLAGPTRNHKPLAVQVHSQFLLFVKTKLLFQ